MSGHGRARRTSSATLTGIEEGLRAGMWTVGVVMTGNEVGCTEAEVQAMDPGERARLRAAGYSRLRAAGAHAVIDGIGDLPAVIDAFEGRLRTSRAA